MRDVDRPTDKEDATLTRHPRPPCRFLTYTAATLPTTPPRTKHPNRQERGRSSGVEHNLAKVGVEGSNPFARSRFSQ